MEKKAVIIGASGLVGNELLSQLLRDKLYTEVIIFVRKRIEISNVKLEQLVVDFENQNQYSDKINGDIIFCCLGTTIKKAGSKEAFIKVDYNLPLSFAKIAKQNNVKTFVLVSSLGANEKSSNFYLKVKGDIEKSLIDLSFHRLIIVRPSMLLGDRKEFRLGELIGKFVMKLFSFLFIGSLKKYKAIEAKQVAQAMIDLSKKDDLGVEIVESNELLKF